MAEKLYPIRKRCKKCSKKLATVVLEGIYCSYACGGFPEPLKNIDDTPRQCKLERNGTWIWKQKYKSEEEVPQRLRDDPATNIYSCTNCRYLHVGHSRAIGTETARLVNDAQTLGTVLLKTRENKGLTRKEVAEKIKTRPIRIKEIEDGANNMDITVIFSLIKYYKMKMNILL